MNISEAKEYIKSGLSLYASQFPKEDKEAK